jgi:DNA-binding PadR family transcriptional regulator
MNSYTFLARLTDDGLIDMFIVGPDGIPVARINEPTQTGEEALAMARAWLAEQEKELEDVEQVPDF